MKTLNQRFKENYLFGCIKVDDEYNIYLMPIAWWILNYEMYDPSFDPQKWGVVFRDNISNVGNESILGFIKSIEEDKISIEELESFYSEKSNKKRRIFFFIDFDAKLFINSFSEIELELYLPNDSWVGLFGNPMEFLPIRVKSLFDE